MPEAFRLDMFVVAAFGAFLLWMRLRYGHNFDEGVNGLVEEISGDLRRQVILRLLLYVLLGATFAILATDPATHRQALAAGLGWTGLLGNLATPSKKRTRT